MSLSDAAARFRKINAEKAQETPSTEPLDPAEARALRSRMLGVLLRDARLDSGYTEQDIANYLGVSVDDILAWEYGYGTPSLPLLEVLAYFLKIPVSHFWGTETLQQQQMERAIDADEYITVRTRMIGLMIRTRRESLGISVDELAQKLDIPTDELLYYEQGYYQIPMALLTEIANILDVSISYFLDANSRVGEFFELLETMKLFAKMDSEVRDFVSVPSNEPYIRLAMVLAKMPTESLRELAEGLLDITL
ncbi:MAG: hypothetical protein CUN55_02805 [Phototrophicales bacterium]|nr:MAG: hypothetical protein CUN55_02805 [Phototrophicales bacterium]